MMVKGWRGVDGGQSYLLNQFPVSESSGQLIFFPPQFEWVGMWLVGWVCNGGGAEIF